MDKPTTDRTLLAAWFLPHQAALSAGIGIQRAAIAAFTSVLEEACRVNRVLVEAADGPSGHHAAQESPPATVEAERTLDPEDVPLGIDEGAPWLNSAILGALRFPPPLGVVLAGCGHPHDA